MIISTKLIPPLILLTHSGIKNVKVSTSLITTTSTHYLTKDMITKLVKKLALVSDCTTLKTASILNMILVICFLMFKSDAKD